MMQNTTVGTQKTTVIAGGKSSQLTVTEIDERYPQTAWLQMLLKKGITIENFHEYASSLSKRHTLAFLEDNPDLRKSGFFGMPLTDDWETYKDAYIDKLVRVNAQIQNSIASIEAAKARIEAAKSSRWNSVPRVLNIPTAPNVPTIPRVPQLLSDLTEFQEMNPQELQSLVNQLQQTVNDMERQNRWKAAEQAKEALEYIKVILKQTEIIEPSLNEPKRRMKKTSRYPPL